MVILSFLLSITLYFLSESDKAQLPLKNMYNFKVFESNANKLKLISLSTIEFHNSKFSVVEYSEPASDNAMLVTFEANITDQVNNKFEFCSYDISVRNINELHNNDFYQRHFFDISETIMSLKNRQHPPMSIEYFSANVVLVSGGLFDHPRLISRSSHSQ
ncbi:hypothetical protein VSA01S_32780 [Vibrio sagamiensis NBRC 104589]|uniref:Uncharacterized protein n=2 Tax=Vibrio sagamiensis TaxID=512650 RepID=A0A511QJD7_9VIBR|nr:hypothetical protein VSA01S_32780 [Vibrio sagamiensis NBRC 104589]